MSTDHDRTIVFLGPSLPRAEARSILDADYRAPVQQGMVLEALRDRPQNIVLIDGYFSWVPSVWHKEILWALDQGVRVFGASSMGALRAVELQAFGMTGYGRVFEDFASGRLEDDDEVAIVHASAGDGYRPLSDAMVNIRYTLAAAAQEGIVDERTRVALTDYCKARVYYERHLSILTRDARRDRIIEAGMAQRLAAWAATNARDVKRVDAAGLLRRLADDPASLGPDRPPTFRFEPTSNWLQLGMSVAAREGVPDDGALARASVPTVDLLTECRLAGDWPAFEAMALSRLLAEAPSFSTRVVGEDEYLSQLARCCIALGVDDLEGLSSWLSDIGWGPTRMARVVEREALAAQALEARADEVPDVVAELLALTGRASALSERGEAKRRWLQSTGRSTGMDADGTEAVAWFRAKLGAPPEEPDSMFARRHGWENAADMTEDVIVEHAFVKAAPVEQPASQRSPSSTAVQA